MHHIKVEQKPEQPAARKQKPKPGKVLTDLMEPEAAPGTSKVNAKRIPFFAGNPAVEVIEGELHLYKDIEVSEADKEYLQRRGGPLPVRVQVVFACACARSCFLQPSRSTLLCVLRVPNYVSLSDLAGTMHAYQRYIANMRIVR